MFAHTVIDGFFGRMIKFDESKYDMTNDIVKETLDAKYHHKMNVAILKGMHCAHEHPTGYDYSDSESDVENNNDEPIPHTSSNETFSATRHTITYNICEYICIKCHNSLKRKKPKLPAQACANGLLLWPIPPVLLNLSDLEKELFLWEYLLWLFLHGMLW